ncbi:hypothetical protein Hanom_Chr02g00155341 [Helianthus anomalus]
MGQLDLFNTLVTGPLWVTLYTRLHEVHEYSMEFYNTFAFKEKAKPFDGVGVQFRCAGEVSPRAPSCGTLSTATFIGSCVVNLRDLSQRRDSTGVVNLRDLTVLYCIHNRVPLDVPHLLLRNMHLNQLASSPTPIFFGGWIYRLFKTYVQGMPKSFRTGPWSGKVDLIQCRRWGSSTRRVTGQSVLKPLTDTFRTRRKPSFFMQTQTVILLSFKASRVHPPLMGVIFLTFKVCMIF